MERTSIYQKEKPIVNNRGFTMIETMIVLLILTILILIIPTTMTKRGSLQFACKKIKDIIIHEKALALFEKQEHHILIKNQTIYLNKDQISIENQVYCEEYELYFNARGNVDKAGTIQCFYQNKTKEIIINLGSGNVYVK